jgi:hypothetical protein
VTNAVNEVRSLLGRLDDATEPGERDRLAEALMRALYRLGIALHRGDEPPESAQEVAAAFEPVLRHVAGALAFVTGSIEDVFIVGLDDWADVAWRRSAIEFLLEILDPDDAAWLRAQLEPDAYDGMIRRYSEDLGYYPPSKIPAGVPTSHWWWWAPTEPEP